MSALIASFIPRLFLIRVHNVLSDLTKSGTFSEVSQDAAADDSEREQLGRTSSRAHQDHMTRCDAASLAQDVVDSLWIDQIHTSSI